MDLRSKTQRSYHEHVQSADSRDFQKMKGPSAILLP